MRITKAQSRALLALFKRSQPEPDSFLQFRRSASPMLCGDGALVIRWAGMWLAIEPDGYCHS